VWFDGEYHLFFQHNPTGSDWGNISWGHAVSPDLLEWHELPVALAATDDEMVFSGSVVVDHADTSGLGAEGGTPLVALYTSHDVATGRQAQCVAYSLDRGRTWTRHAGNPVLDVESTDFRDPKVFWHEDGGYWVMVVAMAVDRVVRLYRSEDLLRWQHLSDFGPRGAVSDVWECPDLFPLQVDGDPSDVRWVLVVSVQGGAPAGGSGMQYFVGDFDGTTFTAHLPADADDVAWLDLGADYYAAVSFAGMPEGRRVMLGWMSNWAYARDLPTESFRGAMSIPRTCELRRVGTGLRLVQAPLVPELEPVHVAGPVRLDVGVTPLPPECHGRELSIVAEFAPGSTGRFGLLLATGGSERTEVGYDVDRGCVYVDRTASGAVGFHPDFAAVHTAALEPERGVVRLHVLLDRSCVEVFAGQGEVVLTDQVFPAADSRGTAVFAEGGQAMLLRLTVTPLDGPGARREADGQRSNSLSSLRETTYRPASPITSR
jgi:fructan beta-fructosidase